MTRQNRLTILMVAFTIFSLFFSSFTPAQAAPLVLSGDSGGDGSGDGTSASSATRIRFAKGATSAEVSGKLAAGGRARYVLRAGAGQLTYVTLSAPSGVSLKVTTSGGTALKALASSAQSFRGYLPWSGDYTIELRAAAGVSGSFSLFVSIPQRVSFRAGTTSASLSGELAAQQSHEYILRAGEGQVLEVIVTSAAGVQLSVVGADGSVLSGAEPDSESGDGWTGSPFRVLLPRGQDYVVALRAGDQAADYDIDLIIPRRISFAKGAFQSVEKGSLQPDASQYYVLRARQGQTMTVKVTASKPVQLIVYGMDGTVLNAGSTGDGIADGASVGKNLSYSGTLSLSQDYIVVIRADSKASSFTLRVKIK